VILVCFTLLYALRFTGFFNRFLFEQIVFIGFLIGFIFFVLSAKIVSFRTTTAEILLVSTLFISLANLSLVNIDRSRSFYLLAWVGDSKVIEDDSGLDLGMVLSNESRSIDAINVRLNEQISRGLVSQSGSEYRLTNLGKVYLLMSNVVAEWFKLENWKVNSK
jgi:hypothetical protein